MDSPRYCDTCKSYGDHHTDRHNLMFGIDDGVTFETRINGVSFRIRDGVMEEKIDGEWKKSVKRKKPSFKERVIALFS